MANLKESETFKEIMNLSQGVIGKEHLAEGFILKLLRNTKKPGIQSLINKASKTDFNADLTLEQLQMEYRIYRIFGDKIVKLWIKYAEEIDNHDTNVETEKSSLKSDLKKTQNDFAQLEKATKVDKNKKEVWSIEEAAEEMGIKKKSLQTKISQWKKEGISLPWLIEQKGTYNRVRAKEFISWLKGHKKAGRPPKKI